MKKMMKLMLAMIATMLVVGCQQQPSALNPELEVMEVTGLHDDRVENPENFSFNHSVDGIIFKTTYSAGENSLQHWKITDSKILELTLSVESVPEGATIFVEHVHADVSVAAHKEQLNGILQDSMDDSYHGYDQPGIYISKDYPYEESFAIEGYSERLISGWSWYTGVSGAGRVAEQRLTESALLKQGAIGNKVQVVYNLNIKLKGEEFFHGRTFVDEFYISTTAAK